MMQPEPLLKIGTEKPSVEVRPAWERYERRVYKREKL